MLIFFLIDSVPIPKDCILILYTKCSKGAFYDGIVPFRTRLDIKSKKSKTATIAFVAFHAVTFNFLDFLYLDAFTVRLSAYLIKNEKRSTFFKAIPAPVATLWRGSSATWNGMLILSVKRLSIPRSNAPPPLSHIPLCTISA